MKTTNNPDLMTYSYDYILPDKLVAKRPKPVRHDSRLLVYNHSSGSVKHCKFIDLAKNLPLDSLLVFNQSKVFSARLIGRRKTGGACEVFVLSPTPCEDSGLYNCLIKTTSRKKVGDSYFFDEGLVGLLEKIYDNGSFGVSFNTDNLPATLERIGRVPIPPYIRDGNADGQDQVSYQTVYAKDVGSVAAPTAGFHFTDEVFDTLSKKEIGKAFVTLHVGVGTFAPVKALNILDHKMHSERYSVATEDLNRIKNSKSEGTRVIAVGTTSLRVLESSLDQDGNYFIRPDKTYETDIFLYPGVEVRSISGLITNFHLPKSSLLMLVSSLIGRERALELYEMARDMEYRFYSYGDAMLILLDG